MWVSSYRKKEGGEGKVLDLTASLEKVLVKLMGSFGAKALSPRGVSAFISLYCSDPQLGTPM